MKAGAKYERFVFEKLKRLFADGIVKLNDMIPGSESGIEREIDVSVRLNVGGTEVLYIVQCKDWASRVDINVLGELTAVMQDVGAAKGFLLCTAGFYATNHQYALRRGIELVTIEDIQSDKWTLEVQIPLVYVRRINEFLTTFRIVANEGLVELNRNKSLTLTLSVLPLRTDGDGIVIALKQYIMQMAKDLRVDSKEGVRVDLTTPKLEVNLAGVWAPCSQLSIVLHCRRVKYLKYLTPTAYSQLRDHVRGTTLPLHCELDNISLRLDETFVELSEEALPVFPGLWLEVEESSIVAD